MSQVFLPYEMQQKMDMAGSGAATSHKCKISMLWNWYTIDSCFFARSWHVTSRGMFAGTCIGIFFWVISYCWLHRFIVEYDNSIINFKQKKHGIDACQSCCGPAGESNNIANTDDSSEDKHSSSDHQVIDVNTNRPGSDIWAPLLQTFSHRWFIGWLKKKDNVIYPNPLEHIGRSGLYLMEWTISYLLMLMWMYYNGYVIITMILGYFFGQLIFNYTPLTVVPARTYMTPSCQ